MTLMRKVPPRLLTRNKATRKARFSITIFTEGKCTEREYFEHVKRHAKNSLVSVNGPCGVPKTIIEKAIEHRKYILRGRKDSFEKGDQIWAVFDCDEHDLSGVFQMARDHSIRVAYSNPCFELWGILHIQDHDAPIHRHAAQKMLEDIMPTYKKSGSKRLDYEMIKDFCPDAIKRARNMHQRREDEGDPLGNPYTNVHELIELIQKSDII